MVVKVFSHGWTEYKKYKATVRLHIPIAMIIVNDATIRNKITLVVAQELVYSILLPVKIS